MVSAPYLLGPCAPEMMADLGRLRQLARQRLRVAKASDVQVGFVDDESDVVAIGSQEELDNAILECGHDLKICVLDPLPALHARTSYSLAFIVLPAVATVVAFLVFQFNGVSQPDAISDPCESARLQQIVVSARVMNDTDQAQRVLERAVEEFPSCTLPLYWAGRLYLDCGEFQLAAGVFDRLLYSDPMHLGARLYRGHALQRLNRPLEALLEFAIASKLHSSSEASLRIARMLSEQDADELVSEAATLAVTQDPESEDAGLFKGIHAFSRGDFESAYAQFAVLALRERDSVTYRIWKRRALDEMFRSRI
ncbi:Tetratricopeptide repeat [Plasmodiophora brassicae]|uniref:Uncharacterized protein n=1 Tax=Plasmodiophora brassicae TaxID=37360 RepID=A0A0G4J328_PLABS|nr:hypothetical protein PBRA_002245 [Plasmodiophora brassicae]SPQ98838.1 unnamed protein product [Plasmodiophora brassicae]